jgi:hypothetical protein
MRHGPKMRCSDECKKGQQIFKTFTAQSLAQCIPCALGLSRLDKDHRRSRKDAIFDLAPRIGPIGWRL